MKARVKNLQPWMDYFMMLQRYERDGFLQTEAEKHEAYLTRAALCTLAEGGKEAAAPADMDYVAMLSRGTPRVLRCIRTYAAWLSREGRDYLSRPFALHVVHEDGPHDLLYTIVLTGRRRWWMPWTWHDSMEVIVYD